MLSWLIALGAFVALLAIGRAISVYRFNRRSQMPADRKPGFSSEGGSSIAGLTAFGDRGTSHCDQGGHGDGCHHA
jgi:hypothetical protein